MKKNILITSARSPATLDLARQLSANGHHVFVADTTKWHICATSKSVEKNFVVPSPRFDPVGFVDRLIQIAETEKLDLIIPTCEEILPLSKHLDYFPKKCRVFASPFNLLHTLHSKWLFTKELTRLGFDSPETHLITSEKQLDSIPFEENYVMKPCYSRASQKIQKVYTPNKPKTIVIEPHNPWVAQKWIYGDKFCTYSVCVDGKVQAHSTYPVTYAIDKSSCLTFESIEHPAIFEWVSRFVKEVNFTGQIAFDFVETSEGKLFAIECNPRATHGLLLFTPEDRLDNAFLKSNVSTIFSQSTTRKQIVMGMLMYGWKNIPAGSGLKEFFSKLFSFPDVVYQYKDWRPLMMIPTLFVRYFWISRKLGIKIPAAFTYDIDWNGEQ